MSLICRRTGSRLMVACRRILIIMASVIAITLLLAAIIIGATWSYPLHASCQVDWKLGLPCIEVNRALQGQIMKWTGPDNCKDGGQKCLYNLTSVGDNRLTATHTTPVAKYIDNLAFTFVNSTEICEVEGYSRAETWYAVLDKGTNYCNLENLITGSGLDQAPGYTESTSNSICTQYTSADCEVY